jgi:hypothetical protein
MRRMITLLLGSLVGFSLLLAGTAGAAANPSPTGPGRPNQSCEDQPTRPGHASTAPGSAFNPNGTVGAHYAGEQPQNSGNGQASQYDVACFQVSTH